MSQESVSFRERIARQFGFALKDQNPNIRFLALEGLQFLKGCPECELVCNLLVDPDRFVKWKAIQVSGLLGQRAAIPLLLKNLNSLDLYTRSFSAVALGQIGDPATLPKLIELSERETSPKVRQQIIRWADRFAPNIPWDFVGKCSFDPDVGVRSETVRLLSFLPDRPESCPILINILERETDTHVFASALLALGRYRRPEILSYFQHSLLHQENRIRANAVEALGAYSFEEIEKIITPFLNDPSNRVKANVISIYFRNGLGTKVHWELQKLLTSANRWERASGAWVAGAYKVSNQLPQLLALVQEEEAVVAERSAWALGKIRAPGTMAALLKAYEKGNQWALSNIIRAMGGIADQNDLTAILKIFAKERNPMLKAQLIDLLTMLKAGKAKEVVQKQLSEGEQRIRASAYTFLGTLDPQGSAETLLQGLSDQHHKVRAVCADLMVKNGDFRSLKVLSDSLNEQDKLQRVQVTQTLRDLAEKMR
jgi:HEAT repeat protein